MKVYGTYFATEFTKKQINVIYGKAKNGELKVEKWFIRDLYELAEYYGHDFNRSTESLERTVKKILELVFSVDIEEAQVLINETEDDWYSRYGKKTKAQCDRDVFVA